MNKTHTPGPWGINITAGNRPLIDSGSYDIAVVSKQPGESAMHANAAFIVRACNAHDDLVAALEKIATGWHWIGECVRTAQAALAKARGDV
jgi:hypothetical protein